MHHQAPTDVFGSTPPLDPNVQTVSTSIFYYIGDQQVSHMTTFNSNVDHSSFLCSSIVDWMTSRFPDRAVNSVLTTSCWFSSSWTTSKLPPTLPCELRLFSVVANQLFSPSIAEYKLAQKVDQSSMSSRLQCGPYQVVT